ncbi:MAG: UDP-glucose 4-epimerase GalE [Clostridiales bacterium]
MKILLTGGAGYIGSHTAVELLSSGYEVVIADDFSNSCPEVLNRIKKITNGDFAFYNINISDSTSLDFLFKKENIDAIIHFAGFKAVGESVEQPIKYYRNNIDSTLTLLEIMAKYKVNKLVFSSSAVVYGITESVPIAEDMPTGCINPYGWTKWMIEQILRDAVIANTGLSVVLLRYFNPIGAHESGLIGESPKGIPNNLMPYISQVAAGKLEKLNIFGDNYPTKDGTGIRDYIHVMDLAAGHKYAIEYCNNHTGCDVFNLGTGVGYSVLDLVNTFQKVNNCTIPYEITQPRAGDIGECYGDVSKAKTVLGWSSKKTLVDMCRDSWHWQKNNPKGYEF